MKIAIVGTYPPTRCGIATFSFDVEQSLLAAGVSTVMVAVDPEAPNGTAPTVRRNDLSSYRRAADWLNTSGVDAVVIEHEFGIYGGDAGQFLLHLTRRLTIPYVVTLHTVLPDFSAAQAAVVDELCGGAAAVTVFTASARRLLLEQEVVAAASVRVVPHGAPVELYHDYDQQRTRAAFGLPPTGPVVSTFGLLSSGKGIEVAIDAVAAVAAECPTLTYVVAGRTHPGVVRTEGERYREMLLRRCRKLGIAARVVFIDRFLDIDEIGALLSLTDLFLTPYWNEDQAVSGALTFALAAGCPVVSTPYRYATDMLADGAGSIVAFGDTDGFAAAMRQLLTDPGRRATARRAASNLSATLSWPAVATTLVAVLESVLESAVGGRGPRSAAPALVHSATLPSTHLAVLCDDTAMLQHSDLGIPRQEEGYCVDDAGRLLPIVGRLATTATSTADAERWTVVTARLLSFLRSAALDGDGAMRNFMSWERTWLDRPHDGDHVGRAIWGLGELLAQGVCVDEAVAILQTIVPRALLAPWSRHLAYTALGVVAAAEAGVTFEKAIGPLVTTLGGWDTPPRRSWQWPEHALTYDNARIPEAMIRLGALVGDDALVDRGVEFALWLDDRCQQHGYYRFPGHRGLLPGAAIDDSGDEQPLEAAAMADLGVALLAVVGHPEGRAMVDRAWSWFAGNNRLRLPLLVDATGACHDALTDSGVNRNCGAESTIAAHRCAAARSADTGTAVEVGQRVSNMATALRRRSM